MDEMQKKLHILIIQYESGGAIRARKLHSEHPSLGNILYAFFKFCRQAVILFYFCMHVATVNKENEEAHCFSGNRYDDCSDNAVTICHRPSSDTTKDGRQRPLLDSIPSLVDGIRVDRALNVCLSIPNTPKSNQQQQRVVM